MASPASTGPSGSHFEAQIAAFYMLCMLTDAEPYGMAGAKVRRIALQQEPEGHHLDDIVLYCQRANGSESILEIQAKRTLTFSEKDTAFDSVMEQIARHEQSAKRSNIPGKYAAACARTTTKIEGPIQDVIAWAKSITDPDRFFARIQDAGVSNDAMRSFTDATRALLHKHHTASDDRQLHSILTRLCILPFDFDKESSIFKYLALDRAKTLSDSHSESAAHALWSHLIDLALERAKAGGDIDATNLREVLAEKGHFLTISADSRFELARAHEFTRFTLQDISTDISGHRLPRQGVIESIRHAAENTKFTLIQGAAGSGKSGLLKILSETYADEACAFAISPNRAPPNGWPELRVQLGVDEVLTDFLGTLCASGTRYIIIDSLDGYNESQRTTILDLVRAALHQPGLSIVATTRHEPGLNHDSWIMDILHQENCPPHLIQAKELSDDERDDLRAAVPELSSFLGLTGSQRRPVTDNLFRLAQATKHGRQTAGAERLSETGMAAHWWSAGDKGNSERTRDRQRVFRSLADALCNGSPLTNGEPLLSEAIQELCSLGTIREEPDGRIAFSHDTFYEWAISYIAHGSQDWQQKLLEAKVTPVLFRAAELCSRFLVEHTDGVDQWRVFLHRASQQGNHGAWRRAILLGLIRSERSTQNLDKIRPVLYANEGELLAELLRLLNAIATAPASQFVAPEDRTPSLDAIRIPNEPSWIYMIAWLLRQKDDIPPRAVANVIEAFQSWCICDTQTGALKGAIVESTHRWLMCNDSMQWESGPAFVRSLDYDARRQAIDDLRTLFLLTCGQYPELAKSYIHKLQDRAHRSDTADSILQFPGQLLMAAPTEFGQLCLRALCAKKEPRNPWGGSMRDHEPFTWASNRMYPTSPGIGPFSQLLSTSPDDGIDLVYGLLNHAIGWLTTDEGADDDAQKIITVSLPDRTIVANGLWSYQWSRGFVRGNCLTCALMALEHWCHNQLDSGADLSDVLRKIVPSETAPGAILLLLVDIAISHIGAAQGLFISLSSIPELLCMDFNRAHLEQTNQHRPIVGPALTREPETGPTYESLMQQPSHQRSLFDALQWVGAHGYQELIDPISERLRSAIQRLGPPGPNADRGDPAMMAQCALNIVDHANYEAISHTNPDGTTIQGLAYSPPQAEREHFEALEAAHNEASRPMWAGMQMTMAVRDPNRLDREGAAEAMKIFKEHWLPRIEADSDALNYSLSAILVTAKIGAWNVLDEYRAEVKEVVDVVHSMSESTRTFYGTPFEYDPIAKALAFLALGALREDPAESLGDLFIVLTAYGSHSQSACLYIKDEISSHNMQLIPSLIRLGIRSCIHPHHRFRHSENKKDGADIAERLSAEMTAAIDREMKWIVGDLTAEPSWPELPHEEPRFERYIGQREIDCDVPADLPDLVFYDKEATGWLALASTPEASALLPSAICDSYLDWTLKRNGQGQCQDVSFDSKPSEWTNEIVRMWVKNELLLHPHDIATHLTGSLSEMPDEAFFDMACNAVHVADQLFLDGDDLQPDAAIALRSQLLDSLCSRSGWLRLCEDRKGSCEMHIGPLICALAMQTSTMLGQPPQCYFDDQEKPKAAELFPVIARLFNQGPGVYPSVLFLNLAERIVSTNTAETIINSLSEWNERLGDEAEFWSVCHLGETACKLIDQILLMDPEKLRAAGSLHVKALIITNALIRSGIGPATALEHRLSDDSETP